MSLKIFPTNFVYWEQIHEHEKIKKELLSLISNYEKLHEEHSEGLINAITSYACHDIHNYIHSDILNKLIWKPLENLLKKINAAPYDFNLHYKKSIISESWYTKYNKDGMFNVHTHQGEGEILNGEIYNTTFSIIYVLKDENEYNSTNFIVPFGNNISHISRDREISFNTSNEKDIREGTVLIFPSSLHHEVLPVKIPGRISLAFNVRSVF